MRKELDGLLTDAQGRDLTAHLDECEACRVESESLSLLTARLQSGFHARWDTQHGPSANVMANVHSQTRRIIMSKRIDLAFNIFGGIVTLLVLAFVVSTVVSQFQKKPDAANGTQVVTSGEQPQGLIAYVSRQADGNREIYTMRADGSEVTNLTNNPATDESPAWSPDGTQIAFVSDRSGGRDIYVMSADGSNLKKLTDSSTFNDHFSWSPDGKKIVYSSSENSLFDLSQLMVMNADGSNKIALTSASGSYTVLDWSPDGQKIVYQATNIGDNKDSRIIVASVEGTGMFFDGPYFEGDDGRRHHQIHWETVEQFITISSNSERPTWGLWNLTRFYTSQEDYLNSIGSNPILITSNSPIVAIFDRTYVVENQDSLTWFVYEGAPIPLLSWNFSSVCEKPGDPLLQDSTHLISPDGRREFVSVHCQEGTTFFFLMNSDGTEIHQLGAPIANPLQASDMQWSPDGKYVIASIADQKGADFYLFDIEKMSNDPSTNPIQLTTNGGVNYGAVWQPIIKKNVVEEKPTPEPTQTSSSDGLIAFVSGNDIFTMNADGSQRTNITNNPAYDFAPAWSPDGTRLAFISDRLGQSEIYVMNADGSNVLQLTNIPDTASWWDPLAWSPDGQWLVASRIPTEMAWIDKGQVNLYVINTDGSGATQITTNEVGNDTNPKWSPDGKSIAFLKTAYTQACIYSIHPDGSGLTKLVLNVDNEGIFDWAPNGELYYLSTDVPCLVSGCVLEDEIGTISANGTNQKSLLALKLRDPSCTSGSLVSSSDGMRLLIRFPIGCTSEGQVFIVNSDGTDFRELINLKNLNLSPGEWISQVTWSPDGKFVVFVAGKDPDQDIYILDVDKVLQDSSTQPIRLTDNSIMDNSPVWQPAP